MGNEPPYLGHPGNNVTPLLVKLSIFPSLLNLEMVKPALPCQNVIGQCYGSWSILIVDTDKLLTGIYQGDRWSQQMHLSLIQYFPFWGGKFITGL